MELFGDIFVAVKINLTSQEDSVTRTSEYDPKYNAFSNAAEPNEMPQTDTAVHLVFYC